MDQTGYKFTLPTETDTTHKKLLRVAKGAHDMLRESAKQHRSRGDGSGHGSMCDAHADEIAKLIHFDT